MCVLVQLWDKRSNSNEKSRLLNLYKDTRYMWWSNYIINSKLKDKNWLSQHIKKKRYGKFYSETTPNLPDSYYGGDVASMPVTCATLVRPKYRLRPCRTVWRFLELLIRVPLPRPHRTIRRTELETPCNLTIHPRQCRILTKSLSVNSKHRRHRLSPDVTWSILACCVVA